MTKTSKNKEGVGKRTPREQKLAEALRANLRRRKNQSARGRKQS